MSMAHWACRQREVKHRGKSSEKAQREIDTGKLRMSEEVVR